MNKKKIYHGSYCAVETPRIIPSKFPKDFGVGFYCTELKRQANRWAKRHATAVISTYQYSPDEELRILHFPEMTEQWLDFIVECRSGKTHNFDIVTGAMANDQIFNYISDLMSGVLTREQFWVLAKFKYPTHQICFCSPRALTCLKYVTSTTIKS